MKRDHARGSTDRYLVKYRAWCRFFPTEFKKRFGDELEQVFQTSLEEAEEKYGEKGMEAEYRAAITDIVPAILHEQLTSLPTVQRMFSGGNLLWRLYVLLYWPLVGLGVLGLTNVNFTPFSATFLVALYLLAHLAIWFATASVRLSVAIAISSIVLLYAQQFSGFVFSPESSVYGFGVDVFNIVAIIAIAVAPYVVSLIVHVRKDKTVHQKVRLLSAKELRVDDEKHRNRRYRRNTIALCTLFALLMVNVAFLVVDSTKAERVWNSRLLHPPYPESLQELKRSDNLYYALMFIDGPKVYDDGLQPANKLLRDVKKNKELIPSDLVTLEQLVAPLQADVARFIAAAEKPYFLHPSLNFQNGWPIQKSAYIEYLPQEVTAFRQLAVVYAVARDNQGDKTLAQDILKGSVQIGKKMAASSPSEGWYGSAMSFIGDVQAILPLVSEETQREVAGVMPTTEEVMAIRKSYLENYTLIAMGEVQDFEQKNGFASLTLFYLPNQTKLDLEHKVTRLQDRKLTCEDTVKLQVREEERYGENYDNWNGFTDYILPRVLTQVAVNGQGKGLVHSLFQYSDEEMYFHYGIATPECEALGFQVRNW